MTRIMLAILAAGIFATAGDPFGDVPHYDHRGTTHLQFYPAYQNKAGLEGEAKAFDFLLSNADAYALPAGLSNLRFSGERVSLTATHYYYQQTLHGYDVKGGEIVVSLDHEKQSVYRIYNNIYPVYEAHEQPKTILGEDDAYDVAWDDLAVHGELIDAPKAQLVYIPEGKSFRLSWLTQLNVEAPFGYWESHVDAVDGRVLSVRDTAISRLPVNDDRRKYNGPVDDRARSFSRFQQMSERAEAIRAKEAQSARLADGTGLVFDPDPRTTLNDETLVDTSPASSFTDAYLTRNLLDLELISGTYHFNGPWISVIDFESPSTAPSTSATGNWTALRGDNAFNDATTYFHIDQSQRYMQSLGFTGPTGIQEGPIGTDTDGLSGGDNSHFIPGSNRMAFGHGCVDDNEDADVILHEYGHAIHYSINASWGGPDAGAIGEGFGDYWAGSYSYSTPNGPIMHPEWVFTWDGHSSCWPGRDLDRTDAIYDPTRSYGAHSSVTHMGATFQSDELWSAPIFNAMLDLIGMGVPREESDQIVLEAHFGLGSNVTMRILGNATIAAAAALQPGGPHAEAFTSRFVAQNIVDIPHVSMAAGDVTVISESGRNDVADPGEMVELHLEVLNDGNLLATNVSATLTSTNPMVTIGVGNSNYPDLSIGRGANNLTNFNITLGSALNCGDMIPLQLVVSWVDSTNAPGTVTLNYSLPTGEPLGMDAAISPALAIEDNTTITSTLSVSGTGSVVSAGFNVDLNITHTYIGDLTVSLTSPNGTTVVLHTGGGSSDDIVGNYPGTLTPSGSLSDFLGDDHDGDWVLTVADGAGGDTGTLNSWAIHDVLGYECENTSIPCFGDLNGDGTVDDDDYNMVMEGWGFLGGDINGDGIGSIIDMMEITDAYGACP